MGEGEDGRVNKWREIRRALRREEGSHKASPFNIVTIQHCAFRDQRSKRVETGIWEKVGVWFYLFLEGRDKAFMRHLGWGTTKPRSFCIVRHIKRASLIFMSIDADDIKCRIYKDTII